MPSHVHRASCARSAHLEAMPSAAGCQRQSGAAHVPAARVPSAGFRILQGTPKRYVTKADSGNDIVRVCCGNCGAHPGQIATLILPSDTSWDEGGVISEALPVPPRPRSDPAQVRNAADILCRRTPIASPQPPARG
jgi:hypothetical protein